MPATGEGADADSVVRYVAAGGVVVDDGRVLLLDRPSRSEIRLPKGHVEPGESAEETARRETAEESGYGDLAVEADLGHQVVAFEYGGREYLREEQYFLMTLTGAGQVERSKKDARQFSPIWVPMDQAEGQLTYEAEREWFRRGSAALRDLEGKSGGAAAP